MRGKKRFKLNEKSLRKMTIKAIKKGLVNTDDLKTNAYDYGHFRFIMSKEKKNILITVTDTHTLKSHKENYLVNTYVRGKVIGKHIVKEK